MPARYLILTITVATQTAASLLQQGVGAILPFIANRLRIDHEHVGFVVASVAGGSAAFVAVAGIMVDYFGEKTVILWTGVTMGIALCAAASRPELFWLVAWMFLFGMAYGASAPAGGRAILLWFNKDRGLAMGIRQAGVPLGGFLGSLLLPVLALHFGYQAAFVTAGVICIIVTLVGVRGYHRPHHDVAPQRETLYEVWQGMLRVSASWSSVCINLTCASLAAVQFTVLSFLALTLISLKHAPLAVAIGAMALLQIGAIAGRLVWGALSDRVFRGDRIAPILLMTIIACAGLLWLSRPGYESPGAMFTIAGVIGISVSGWNGLFFTIQAEIGGHRLAGSAIGAGLTTSSS